MARINRYCETYGIEITASREGWTVTGDGHDGHDKLTDYTSLMCYLAQRYGWRL